jgi:UDP-glucuronate 4-epimerase
MKNIFITGFAGFIGSHLTEQMLLSGNTVIGVDNFDSFYARSIKEKNISGFRNIKNFRLYELDLLDKDGLKSVFETNKIDLVVHLAAKAGVRPSIVDPAGYYDTNVIGTLNLLEAMKKCGCKKMIFASSSSVYGNNKKVPFSEDDNADNPISPYAATKKAGELLCHTYYHLYGFNIFCLRFFTVYGPRQRPDLAIHRFAKLIMEGKTIPFYGDGNTARDYTFINDIVDGIMSAINNLNGYDIFNIGESKTITLSKMVSVLENVLGKKAILEKLPLQIGDVERTYADISKAQRILNYSPSFSFEKGIEEFINWLKNN